MRNIRPMRAQRGVATLLFITFIALGLAAATAAALSSTQGAQKLQIAEHTVTQAEMSAWAGVTLLSKAVEALPKGAKLTAGAAVTFEGAQPGISARYVEQKDGLFVFEVIGSSAGARSVVRTALRPPSAPSSPAGGGTTLPGGATLHGPTILEGSVTYTGATPKNLYVIDGPLTLQGSVNGLEQVCATGDVTVSSAISVEEVCSNGNVLFNGGASVTRIKARGNVTLSGGGTSAIGDIHSNGNVTLSGGSAMAGAVLASGNVSVTGGNARATNLTAEGNVNWTSSNTASTIASNGTVNYRPSGTNIATDISAIGNVMLTSARNVKTKGATTLVGYWGQGISGRLDGQGLLGGGSWGSGGGAVVGSGTVGSVILPKPGSVNVTVSPGYTVAVPFVVVQELPLFEQPKVTVDAYALKALSNLAFMSMDASNNPRVKVSQVNGIPDGDYFIARNNGASSENFLCKAVSGSNCVTPLIKVCHGYSNSNRCFSYSGGKWKIEGTTMLPWVLWFEGNLEVGNGSWVNSFLATGDIGTSGSVKVYSPNYPQSGFTCQGTANSNPSLPTWASNGLGSGTSAYAKQLCSGSPAVLSAAAVGNTALLAGGIQNGSFVGGNITLGSSNEIYGAIVAGQFLNTGGSTTVEGAIYSANQGGSAAKTENRQRGSTTVKVGGGSSAFKPDSAPCMANCGAQEANTASNVVWAAPV